MTALRVATPIAFLRTELLEARSDTGHQIVQRVEVRSVTVTQSPPWLLEAACKGKPTSWWFPERGDVFTAAVARAICSSCPVRAECLDDALTNGEPVGIWGGKSAVARVRMLRRAAGQPVSTTTWRL